MHAKLDTASDLNRYYWYYWGSHKCVFQNAVFLLSVCFILITDSSCQEPAHALAKARGCRTPTAHGYMGMCACCVRMSNHSGCKPLQTLCVTLQGSLWAVWEGCRPCAPELPGSAAIPGGSRACFGGSSWTQASLFSVWWAPCQTVSCKGTGGVGQWPKACLAGSLRQGCDRLDCHGDTVPPHQTCFRSMLKPDSSCPNFSWLKITSLGLVCQSEEGHEWRCLWKTALWHHLPSPLTNGWN